MPHHNKVRKTEEEEEERFTQHAPRSSTIWLARSVSSVLSGPWTVPDTPFSTMDSAWAPTTLQARFFPVEVLFCGVWERV